MNENITNPSIVEINEQLTHMAAELKNLEEDIATLSFKIQASLHRDDDSLTM